MCAGRHHAALCFEWALTDHLPEPPPFTTYTHSLRPWKYFTFLPLLWLLYSQGEITKEWAGREYQPAVWIQKPFFVLKPVNTTSHIGQPWINGQSECPPVGMLVIWCPRYIKAPSTPSTKLDLGYFPVKSIIRSVILKHIFLTS